MRFKRIIGGLIIGVMLASLTQAQTPNCVDGNCFRPLRPGTWRRNVPPALVPYPNAGICWQDPVPDNTIRLMALEEQLLLSDSESETAS